MHASNISCDTLTLAVLAILQAKNEAASEGPSTSSHAAKDEEEEEVLAQDDDDDDELDLDELNELEASLSKTSIHICEPGIEA